MKLDYGKKAWDGCIFNFEFYFRKKNQDYLLEFETSRHYLTIHLFSDLHTTPKVLKFVDKLFSRIERIKFAKNETFLNERFKRTKK